MRPQLDAMCQIEADIERAHILYSNLRAQCGSTQDQLTSLDKEIELLQEIDDAKKKEMDQLKAKHDTAVQLCGKEINSGHKHAHIQILFPIWLSSRILVSHSRCI